MDKKYLSSNFTKKTTFVAKDLATKNIAMIKSNPFKFGSIVDEPYFTNRVNELQQLKQLLQSQNHVILISPRRYGKTSLMMKVVGQLDRPYIFLDMQLITDVTDFATQLLKRICFLWIRFRKAILKIILSKGLKTNT